MVDRYTKFQTGHGRMLVAQPLAADFKGADDWRFVVEERDQIAALGEIDDALAISLDPVRLSREDKCAFAERREFPCREQRKVAGLARIGLLLSALRRLLL